MKYYSEDAPPVGAKCFTNTVVLGIHTAHGILKALQGSSKTVLKKGESLACSAWFFSNRLMTCHLFIYYRRNTEIDH